jgi:hypothetical protein
VLNEFSGLPNTAGAVRRRGLNSFLNSFIKKS